MKKLITILFIVCTLFAYTALAEDMRLESRLEMSNVSLGNPVYLYLTFYGNRDVRAPEVNPENGLTVKYVGPSTKISVVNGRVSQSVIHSYLVIPRKAGQYTLGPFFTHLQANTYRADPVVLTVSGSPSPPSISSRSSSSYQKRSTPAPSAADSSYISDNVFMVLDVPKRRAYINELIPITIKVYIRGVGLKDIEYPVYDHEGFATEEFGEPEKRSEVKSGVRYDVLVFHQEISGIKEGTFTIGPAALNCKVITRKKKSRRASFFGASVFDNDFFSTGQGYKVYPVELSSKPVEVRILPFPSAGRPRDFNGAVGSYDMDVHVDPREVKVGDPVSVRMEISGLGNMATVTEPRIAVGDNFKTYEPQVTQKEHKKIYEQIIIPRTSKVNEIPEISFSYFDSRIESYRTLRKGPFKIDVKERPESEKGITIVSGAGEQEVFYQKEDIGQGIVHIKENLGNPARNLRPVYGNILFWFFQVLVVGMFSGIYVTHGNNQRMRKDKSYAKFLKAPKKARAGIAKASSHLGKNDIDFFYDVIFRTFQDYLSGRLNIPKGGVDFSTVETRVVPSGCPEELLMDIKQIFSECEMARYAPASMDSVKAEETLNKVKKVIGQLERIKV